MSNSKETLTLAICTYNRAGSLPDLLAAICAQTSPIAYEVLIVNNNSTDETEKLVHELKAKYSQSIKIVNEFKQGISHARNRAIEESLNTDYLLFIDDDELPRENFINAAYQELSINGAECVGGRVLVKFPEDMRPAWLQDNLLGFLAQTDYGDKPFWINDGKTPLWTANIGYRMSIFRDAKVLRFDSRYNREGKGVGGGEDVIMFNRLLAAGMKVRYCPGMVVDHHIEEWRLSRTYFLKLHFKSGMQFGRFECPVFKNSIAGVAPFMLTQFMRHLVKSLYLFSARKTGALRQAMNASHSLGIIVGAITRRTGL